MSKIDKSKFGIVPPLTLASPIIFLITFILFAIVSCTILPKEPEHVKDAIKCKMDAYNICGDKANAQAPCMINAQRYCMKWAGYHLKKGRIVKPTNNCDVEPK